MKLEIQDTREIVDNWHRYDSCIQWVSLDSLKETIKRFQSKKKQITNKILIQEELKENLLQALGGEGK
jgi:hypothetical protein